MAHASSYTDRVVKNPPSSSRSRLRSPERRGELSRSRRTKGIATNGLTAMVRTFLGIVFVVSGLNGFLKFLPQFTMSSEGVSFIDALVNSYFWPLLKIVELIVGGALLFNVFSQFAIFILAPVTLGILWFHVFVSPPGAWFAWSIFAAEVILVLAFAPQLKAVFFPSNEADSGKVIHDDVNPH